MSSQTSASPNSSPEIDAHNATSKVTDTESPPQEKTPPPNPPTTPIVPPTPHSRKPGNSQRHSTSEASKQDNKEQKMLWRESLLTHFRGIRPVDEFLATYLPPPQSEHENTIADIVTGAATKLAAATNGADSASVEDHLSPSLLEYLREIVSSFPAETKPSFADTHGPEIRFPPIDPEDHYTRPDITATRPGQAIPPKWTWPCAGTVLELKFKTDIFSGNEVNMSEASQDALVQLAKNARSLLASGSCFVFVIAVFGRQARILRFDHAGYIATEAFDWTSTTTILPTFFWRLYNPDREAQDVHARMYGEDNTISVPTLEEKMEMYKLWQQTTTYNRLPSGKRMSFLDATTHSRWVKAVQIRDGAPVDVDCFTIGPPLSQSDGLFSRATRVDRVIVQGDPDATAVYALKDAWRQACRRPEADFYDVIHKHCELKGLDSQGMAKCHGTLELSSRPHHTTNLAGDAALERCHARTLLTPVGGLITTFATTKALVAALEKAVKHHLIAYEAGVLHRDISAGNVLIDEITLEGFLVDWDYAEFNEEGLRNFENWFPSRHAAAQQNAMYMAIDKSLKELTGTFAFLAIQIMKATPKHNAGHDLESLYWLLIWVILRHTACPGRDAKACHTLFDHDLQTAASAKTAWIGAVTPLPHDLPLFDVAEALRRTVLLQNPNIIKTPISRVPDELAEPPTSAVAVEICHTRLLAIFKYALTVFTWPTDDKAIPFVPPAVTKIDAKVKTQTEHLRVTALQRSARGTRGVGVPEPCVAPSDSSKKRKHADTVEAAGPPAAITGTLSGESFESASKKPKIKEAMKLRGGAPRPPEAKGPLKKPSRKVPEKNRI